MDSLSLIGKIATSGLRAQGERMRVVSENVANANSTANEPGGDPYRRKVVSFGEMLDDASGVSKVEVADVERDMTDFTVRYEPSHPAADESGYVKMPNVNPLIEMSNMREASRSYEANLTMLENARAMRNRLIDMIE
ncbi:flagellar basal body rod protein FlgC [Cognatishimia activa]|uniref:Flagellar basal-body rod protein FlgC n=1 Tax=Cognatishimia activa TaxID=1715691 RepID=A0A0P1IQY7_9RHOB|nr:flagellar basal body rod protein FlgC [Cognatishimia activa]CUI96211.1 Putative proximal rod protein [Cognatishimia activa]CUK25871.1 Putative proximal rod protein [Cognatishimia activa]